VRKQNRISATSACVLRELRAKILWVGPYREIPSHSDHCSSRPQPAEAIRKWRGETQRRLASTTGIGQGYLSDLENGRRMGSPDTIERLAYALNVPVNWLS
jgi:hypothetical protein